MKLLQRSGASEPKARRRFSRPGFRKVAFSMIEDVPINVMFADRSAVIRYANPATINTLRKVQHLLPINVDDLVGSSIDVFHKNPEHQRRFFLDPSKLPHAATFPLGDEWLSLKATAVTNSRNKFVGVMVTWAVITDLVNMEHDVSANVGVAVEQMRSSIHNIANSAAAAYSLTDQLAELASGATDSCGMLSEASKQISSVVDVITNVTTQTKLLALNATIESARAGESGRGFAIVANEVKELAEGTNLAAASIADQTDSIQSSVEAAIEAMAGITGMVGSVRNASQAIAADVEAQSVVAEEISRNTSDLIAAFAGQRHA